MRWRVMSPWKIRIKKFKSTCTTIGHFSADWHQCTTDQAGTATQEWRTTDVSLSVLRQDFWTECDPGSPYETAYRREAVPVRYMRGRVYAESNAALAQSEDAPWCPSGLFRYSTWHIHLIEVTSYQCTCMQ